MIDPRAFLASLDEAGIRFVTGVPDSLLKDVCACIADHYSSDRHVIAANEGSAVGLAIGHYLATGNPALVYMQNSGLGNAINPITSLADPQIYGIPILLMIGWRGEILSDGSQLHDEPQHRKQGQITPALLDILGIPYRILDEQTIVRDVIAGANDPVALLVRKGTFAPYVREKRDSEGMRREEAIASILNALPDDVPVVATTGMSSRELFELRKTQSAGHERDFLTVGGMGHASQIATGIALAKPDQKVVCIDGDGAMLMHMGALSNSAACRNLLHIVINNGAHDSVGGQPTKGASLDLTQIASACGYGAVARAHDAGEIESNLRTMLAANHSCFLEIACRPGARANLGRPDRAPAENKIDFMRFLARRHR